MELNIKIFELVLVHQAPLRVCTIKDQEFGLKAMWDTISLGPFTASSIWYHLALEIFLSKNTFAFCTHEDFVMWERELASSMMSLYRNRIQHICIFGMQSPSYRTFGPHIEEHRQSFCGMALSSLGELTVDVLATSATFHNLRSITFECSAFDWDISHSKRDTLDWRLWTDEMKNDELVKQWSKIIREGWANYYAGLRKGQKLVFPIKESFNNPVKVVLRTGKKEIWMPILKNVFEGIDNVTLTVSGSSDKIDAASRWLLDITPIWNPWETPI